MTENIKLKEDNINYNNIEIDKWEDFKNIDINILRGIYSNGFEKPSPIQKKAISPMVDGKDLIAQAQSGTGKTGAFTIGLLNLIDFKKDCVQCIVVSPTRELSIQTKNVIESIGVFLKNLKCKLLIGGTSIDEDINYFLKNKPQILVGCTGRIQDTIKRGLIDTKDINIIVLDEADEMLSTGFKDQIYNIFRYLNENVQVCLFSATIPYQINEIIEKVMREPVKILVKSDMLTLEGIKQYYIALEDDNMKYTTLKDLYQSISVSQCIIYCNSVKRVNDLYDAMIQDNFPVTCIHSNMEKYERTDAFNDFKNGKSRVLVSSNVTARGIDIQQVSTVINFDIPKCVHTYLHRIGRSGRWGRKGTGINFITKRDIRLMKNIEEHYQTEISELPSSFVETR